MYVADLAISGAVQCKCSKWYRTLEYGTGRVICGCIFNLPVG